MKILRVVALGLLIIMLKFLTPKIFSGIENTLLVFFETIQTVLGQSKNSMTAGIFPGLPQQSKRPVAYASGFRFKGIFGYFFCVPRMFLHNGFFYFYRVDKTYRMFFGGCKQLLLPKFQDLQQGQEVVLPLYMYYMEN